MRAKIGRAVTPCDYRRVDSVDERLSKRDGRQAATWHQERHSERGAVHRTRLIVEEHVKAGELEQAYRIIGSMTALCLPTGFDFRTAIRCQDQADAAEDVRQADVVNEPGGLEGMPTRELERWVTALREQGRTSFACADAGQAELNRRKESER